MCLYLCAVYSVVHRLFFASIVDSHNDHSFYVYSLIKLIDQNYSIYFYFIFFLHALLLSFETCIINFACVVGPSTYYVCIQMECVCKTDD